MSAVNARSGDVFRYDTDGGERWCREGYAVAEKTRAGVIVCDTFWASFGDAHVLTPTELQNAELLFNTTDYETVPNPDQWERFAPEDRERVTSQHGLQATYYVRRGAVENLATQVDNARARLEEAEEAAERAQRAVEWRRQDLTEALAKLEAAQVPA